MKWKSISAGLRYFLVGLIGIISATDIIPQKSIKLYVLLISIAILVLKAIDVAKGIPITETNEVTKINIGN